MFKYFMFSIVIAPLLVGALAVKGRGAQDRSSMRVTWVVYGILWFAVLYYLRHRWR